MVVSTEVFEHTPDWDLILLNMLRLVKSDGMIIFSCASLGRVQHGTSTFHPSAAPYVAGESDYYLNLTASDFHRVINFDYWFSFWHFIQEGSCLYFLGFARSAKFVRELAKTFKSKYDDYIYKVHRLGLPHEYIINENLL